MRISPPFLLALLLAAGFLGSVWTAPSIASGETPLKVATVDLQLALNEVEDGKRAVAQIEGFAESKQRDIAKKEDQVKALSKSLEEQAPLLTPDARVEKEQQLQAAILEYQQLAYEANLEMQNMELELRGKILEKLSRAAQQVATERGLDLVLEASGVVHSVNRLDITAAVVAKHNGGG